MKKGWKGNHICSCMLHHCIPFYLFWNKRELQSNRVKKSGRMKFYASSKKLSCKNTISRLQWETDLTHEKRAAHTHTHSLQTEHKNSALFVETDAKFRCWGAENSKMKFLKLYKNKCACTATTQHNNNYLGREKKSFISLSTSLFSMSLYYSFSSEQYLLICSFHSTLLSR